MGQNVTYTITVTNNGPHTASTVAVADPTPANLTFVSNSGACTTAFPCSLGSIANGASASITATYSTSASFSGGVTNTASVSSTTFDPSNGNNSASKSTTVDAAADLSIVKTDPATVIGGDGILHDRCHQ